MLVLGVVGVDFAEGVVVDHDAASGPEAQRHLTLPCELNQVACLVQVVGVAGLAVLRAATLLERSALRRARPAYFNVLDEFEVGEACDFERLAFPDEVLPVEVDALRLDSEELALHRLELLRVLDLANDRATLVARNDVVARQELLLQVFVREDCADSQFFRLAQLVSEPVVDDFLECDQMRDLDGTRPCRLRVFFFLIGWFLARVWLRVCGGVCLCLLLVSSGFLTRLFIIARLDCCVLRIFELAPVFNQCEEGEFSGVDTAALEQILGCQLEQVVFQCGAIFAVEHDLLRFERFLVRLILLLVEFDGGVCVFGGFVVCELDFEWVQIRNLVGVFERRVELEVVDQENEFLVFGIPFHKHFTKFRHVHVLFQFY